MTVTIVDRGKELLDSIVAAARALDVPLPEERYVYLGPSRITCASVVVAITNIAPYQDPNDFTGQLSAVCDSPLQLSIVCGIVRDGIAYNDDGTTDLAAVVANNKTLELDKDALFMAVDLLSRGMVRTLVSGMDWEYEGLLMSSTLTLTTGESTGLD